MSDSISIQSMAELACTADLGRFRMKFQQGSGCLTLVSLCDSLSDTEWLASQSIPLFSLVFRDSRSGKLATVEADWGWYRVGVLPADRSLQLVWEGREELGLTNLIVRAQGDLNEDGDALEWSFSVDLEDTAWGLWRAKFPQLALSEPVENASVLYPFGPGTVRQKVWQEAFEWGDQYPNGWCTMPFCAVYGEFSENRSVGFYFGMHDADGCTRHYSLKSDPERKVLNYICDTPPAGMGEPGLSYQLSGKMVWRFFEGDWYDAAMIYRDWALSHAKWIPEKNPREDTPSWFHQSLVWIRMRGDAEYCVPRIKKFAEAMGLPVGFHWYNWHQIPYDNDYPHFFPAKEGFVEGVRQLQDAGIRVMPYINGRLWDTRDRGLEDWQFTSEALPAATKDEKGEPYTESYFSVEEDGSPVKLANMCPTTDVWRNKLRELVGRLLGECGVDGVYIDQIAAASPRLCFDSTHDHPAGGGSWWNEAYQSLLRVLRDEKPAETILTSECNAEPFLAGLDGFLTWHWQYLGQVPAFSAIYGGRIQMFGRSFRKDSVRGQAFRMKAGQQLVFGEQVGWVESAEILDEPDSLDFLRRVGRLRKRFAEYFYCGRLLRPPSLRGTIPEVEADWNWTDDPWPVKDKAVLTGAWKMEGKPQLVLLFVNLSDQPIEGLTLDFKGSDYQLQGSSLRVNTIKPEKDEEVCSEAIDFSRTLNFAPCEAFALEIEIES